MQISKVISCFISFNMTLHLCSQNPVLYLTDAYVEHEIDFPLEIRVNKELSIYGIAGTVLFDPGHLIFKGVRSDHFDEFGIQHFNTSELQNGQMSFIYINPDFQ